MNLPNKITIIRVIAVPFFVVLFNLNYAFPAAILFCIASATDALDGYIARKRGLVTNFGKIMDPLADKVLVLSAFICLVPDERVAPWMAVVIIARELVIGSFRTIAASKGIVIAAGISGKVKTVLQMIAAVLLMLGDFWIAKKIAAPVLWVAVAATAYSGLEYIYKNREILRSGN